MGHNYSYLVEERDDLSVETDYIKRYKQLAKWKNWFTKEKESHMIEVCEKAINKLNQKYLDETKRLSKDLKNWNL